MVQCYGSSRAKANPGPRVIQWPGDVHPSTQEERGAPPFRGELDSDQQSRAQPIL